MPQMPQPQRRRFYHIAPTQMIMLGFALMILAGGFLLSLPVSSQPGKGIGFLDALFVATSANCVTGLIVVNTMEQWSAFGKVVIIVLIQFGGLGFITVMTGAMLLAQQKISLRNRLVIQSSFSQDNIGGMVKLIKTVVLVTLFFEAIGAVLLGVTFSTTMGMTLWESTYHGVFHSISAFCNAGFDNITTNSLVPVQTNLPLNLIIMALIVAGGIGFTVWSETGHMLLNTRRSLRTRLIHLSLHAKIVFVVTGILIALGTALFLLLEWDNPGTIGALSPGNRVLVSLFQSVTLRTAGFDSMAQGGLTEASKFLSSVLMVIGGSSASAAGGMKTVTLGIIFFSMLSVARGRKNLEAFGRTLPMDLLQKALTVATAILTVLLAATLVLHFTERGNPYPHGFLDLMFECASAVGTVGVTTGITPHLSTAGKIVIMLCMYLGRIGPVTVIVALNARRNAGADGIALPRERVIIG